MTEPEYIEKTSNSDAPLTINVSLEVSSTFIFTTAFTWPALSITSLSLPDYLH